MTQISLPDPPEEVILDFHKIARRWKTDLLTVEAEIQGAGFELIEVPQRPRLGVKLSDVLRFESRRREALAARDAQMREVVERSRLAQREAQERAGKHKEESDQKVTEALGKEKVQ